MTDAERALVRAQYDLLMELFHHQGEEIEALRKATQSLTRSHEAIGNLLTITAKLMGIKSGT